jgi:DNA-binding response OmpR family regulator
MPRILIADRDESIALLLKAALTRALAADVTMAHDAAAAGQALQSSTFDLILLDIGMYSDGMRTLREVRGRNANCEVIALTTGAIRAPLLKTLTEADVYAVVMKPFDVAQLVATIAESLRSDRIAQPNRPLVYRDAGNDPSLD